MSEELKPCPFCGGNNLSIYEFDPFNKSNGGHTERHGVKCNDCQPERASINEWQNAYCWKRLSHLSAVNERLREFVLKCCDCDGEHEDICEAHQLLNLAAELETQTDEMKGKL